MLQVKFFEFNPIAENTYIVFNEQKECAIIDPGCYFPEEKEMLQTFINDNGLKPILLLNTHCHLDHVFGNKFVAETYNLTLGIHPLEKKLLEYAPTSGLMYNLPFENYVGEIYDLVPGEEIKIGNDRLKILFTPGHSPGIVSFYNAEESFLISGDALFHHSIGRTDLPGGDYDTLINAIKNELLVLPQHTKVFSGHGPMTTIGEEAENNPFLE